MKILQFQKLFDDDANWIFQYKLVIISYTSWSWFVKSFVKLESFNNEIFFSYCLSNFIVLLHHLGGKTHVKKMSNVRQILVCSTTQHYATTFWWMVIFLFPTVTHFVTYMSNPRQILVCSTRPQWKTTVWINMAFCTLYH